VVLITAVVFNAVLFKAKKTLTESAQGYFVQKILIGSIFYLPPNFIILRNISALETATPAQKQLFFIPTISAKLSLRRLIMKGQLSLSGICFYSPRMDYYEALYFIKENFVHIMVFIRSLSKQDFKFFIKAAKLDLYKDNNILNYIAANCSLALKDGSVSGSGLFREDKEILWLKNIYKTSYIKRGPPLRFRFNGHLADDGFSIENSEFLRENLYSKLWGGIRGDVLQFNGFVFLNTLFVDSDYQEPALHMVGRIKVFLRGPDDLPQLVDLPKPNVYLLDIDCQAKLAYPQIQIERFTFSLNNTPISIKGNFLLSDPISLDLIFSFWPPHLYLVDTQLENLKRLDLGIKGIFQDSVFKGDGMLSLDFSIKKNIGFPSEKFEVSLRGLALHLKEFPVLKMYIEESDLFNLTKGETSMVSLNNFNAVFNLRNERLKFVEFHSLFYDGILEGQARVDIVQLPPRITSTIRLKNVDALGLSRLLVHFSKIHGRLASQIQFSNYPDLGLKGKIIIQNGYLHNFDFFRWLADSFDLPFLKRLYFSKVSTNFSVNSRGASLSGILLDSDSVNLNGYFSLDRDNLVSSKLSLVFAKELLRQSPRFRPLLKLLGRNLTPLNFDFQLSGGLYGMNFQWLESDFKKQIKDSIPEFMKRGIEKEVEDIIKSISAK
jgi:hypothetical protein